MLRDKVKDIVNQTKITDIHTHVFPPAFGSLLLWGIDELLTYHYLVAETMRWTDMPYERFWSLSKKEQADLVWQKLFIENSPYSEACRGVLTVLQSLGLDTSSKDLPDYRKYFASLKVEDYIDIVFDTANLDCVVMTNDPFDPAEKPIWKSGTEIDPRFKAVLRLDGLLVNWQSGCKTLRDWGYDTEESLTPRTLSEVRRFLKDWCTRIRALYMAVSLPDTFILPEDSPRAKLIEECVIPVSREINTPFALMIGVKRQVNPALKLAGDAVGKADVNSVEYLCAKYPENKFLVTMLSKENQHELAVAARKFRNLMIFGCWWFLNNPSIIEEITRFRFELLGVSVIPQHSDARVFDQVIYKWAHSRRIIAEVLADKYEDLAATGWAVTETDIRRDAAKLLGGNFWNFIECRK